MLTPKPCPHQKSVASLSLSQKGVCVCLAIPSHSGQTVHMTETAVRLSMRGESLEPVEYAPATRPPVVQDKKCAARVADGSK